MSYDAFRSREHVASPDAVAALRSALATPPPGDEPAVREALGILVSDARTRGLRAEDVVITLKDVLESLSPAASATPAERQRRTEQLVTMAIRAYFGE